MTKSLLDKLGSEIISEVRDRTIRWWYGVISGVPSYTPTESKLKARLNNLTDEERCLIQELIPAIVDNTLHDLLFLLEGSDWIHIGLNSDDEVILDVRKIARGDLQGYIFIWSEKYSKYPSSD